VGTGTNRAPPRDGDLWPAIAAPDSRGSALGTGTNRAGLRWGQAPRTGTNGTNGPALGTGTNRHQSPIAGLGLRWGQAPIRRLGFGDTAQGSAGPADLGQILTPEAGWCSLPRETETSGRPSPHRTPEGVRYKIVLRVRNPQAAGTGH
jgi:hypothetical protein